MSENSEIKNRNWQTWIFWILILYFAFKLVYLALVTGTNIPPDEVTHIGIIKLYAKNVLFVDNSSESYTFGLVTNVPYLYHFLMGKLLKLNLFNLDNIVFLRFLNIILSVLTVFFSYRLVSFLTQRFLVRVLFLIMLTNTLMFTFISFAVSYDNLVNLCSVLSIYFLFAYFKRQDAQSLLLFAIFVSAGALTKITFLPLALILFLILIFHQKTALLDGAKAIVRDLRSLKAGTLVCIPLCILLGLGVFWLYGKNLLIYGKVVPSCEQVIPAENCMKNRIYARNAILADYRDDKISYQEAINRARAIPMPNDRMHAMRLLENERNYKIRKPQPINRLDYIQMVWKNAIMPTVFGIQAHLSMLKSRNELIPYGLMFFLAFVFWVRYISFAKSDRSWIYLSLVFGIYVFFLIGFFNYNGYLKTHAPYLGVQGRYIFPVLVPFYLLVARFLLIPFRKQLATIVFLLVAGLFIWGDFPYFSKRVTDDWRKEIAFQSSYEKNNCLELERARFAWIDKKLGQE